MIQASKQIIQLGIPTKYSQEVVDLYYEAFDQKMNFLFNDKINAKEVILESLELDRGVICIKNDELVGVAGLKFKGKSLVNIDYSSIFDHYSLTSSIGILLKLILFNRLAKRDELLMDGIVVKKEYRGQKIGTHLLNYIFEFAKERNFKQIRLDVIDTNPNAKRLYEKLGFRDTKKVDTSFLSNRLGFNSVHTMIKEI